MTISAPSPPSRPIVIALVASRFARELERRDLLAPCTRIQIVVCGLGEAERAPARRSSSRNPGARRWDVIFQPQPPGDAHFELAAFDGDGLRLLNQVLPAEGE